MIVLDLYSEVAPGWTLTESFFGKRFIWAMLHNFGGNVGLGGSAERIFSGPRDALANNSGVKGGGSMVGVGLTMEGTLQNYPIYDLMLEQGWRPPVQQGEQQVKPLSLGSSGMGTLSDWFRQYAFRRYGVDLPGTAKGWSLLLGSVYNNTQSAWSRNESGRRYWGVTKSLVVLRPSPLNMTNDKFMPTALHYDPADVVDALRALLGESEAEVAVGRRLEEEETFNYDIVDVSRQALSNLFLLTHNELVAVLSQRPVGPGLPSIVECLCSKLLSIIDTMDTVLCADQHFLLGRWIDSARKARPPGDPQAPASFYEWNARNQITLWGPNGEISDYASKQWAGLVSNYYRPRWALFARQVVASVQPGAELFNQTAFNAEVLVLEQAWQHDLTHFSTTAAGNAVQNAHDVLARYF
jgi:alpha-N-acetylglucosaminidase